MVGANVTPSQIQQGREEQPDPVNVLRDHGWTPDGGIWIAYSVSENMLETGLATIPAAKRPYLDGEFRITFGKRRNVGRLVVGTSSAWGLGPFFRRVTVTPESILVLEFHRNQRTVRIWLGDEQVLDRFFGT